MIPNLNQAPLSAGRAVSAPPFRPTAIEYALEMPCEPKRRFGRAGLFQRLRRRDRIQVHLPPAPEEIALAREAEFQLRPVAFHCSRCPANHARREFGCFGVVSYPVSRAAEAWLMELLPRSLQVRDSDPAGTQVQVDSLRELLRRIGDLGITGEPVEECRGDGFIMESPVAISRRYGTFLRPLQVSSSQLLHLMFFRPRVHPAVGELLCRSLGAWVDSAEPGEEMAEAIFTIPVEQDDDPSVAAIKRFLLALMVARSLDLEVYTSTGLARIEAGAGP